MEGKSPRDILSERLSSAKIEAHNLLRLISSVDIGNYSYKVQVDPHPDSPYFPHFFPAEGISKSLLGLLNPLKVIFRLLIKLI
ncbi:hypothetical protein J4456_00775 [Candidatus Pacearchaeota archaeon]|nr:hypothetical protein [Candidatus Pacearchaeota archaeon]